MRLTAILRPFAKQVVWFLFFPFIYLWELVEELRTPHQASIFDLLAASAAAILLADIFGVVVFINWSHHALVLKTLGVLAVMPHVAIVALAIVVALAIASIERDVVENDY